MTNSLSILGIVGSLRKRSYNLSAMLAAKELTPSGVAINIFDLHDIPGFSEDDEQNPPKAVIELKKQIRAADAILFATPEYNYSVPGVLKNAIDWASRPYGDSAWAGKPGAIMGASVGTLGTARAQYHLRQICVNLDISLLNRPEVMISGAAQKFDSHGRLQDEPTKKHIQGLVEALVEWTKRVGQSK